MEENDQNIDPPQAQRDFIRDAVRRLIVKNRTMLGWEYAEAERAGKVPRQSNRGDMDAARYGERLIDDALRKGWL